MTILRSLALITCALTLAGCSTADKLSKIGQAPVLTAITDPTTTKGYQEIVMPMPAVNTTSYAPNSLFRSGSKGFFKDQRAHQVGDILSVMVIISDKADFSNSSSRKRASTQTNGVSGALGSIFDGILGAVPTTILPTGISVNTAIDTASAGNDTGEGGIHRAETLQTQVSVIVTQVLPNGNLVIEGRQEVRLNFEVRDMIVAGIVRPEDISSTNTIDSRKIAEARISYGGRGNISEMQTPRYGAQVLEAILPF